MRTSQNISGIIWTSSKYCNDILDKLVEKGLVSWWAFIRHKAESSDGDEQAGRDHIHCYITPSKILDTDILANCWDEVTDDGLHLGAGKVWRKSKTFADWYLYALHDENYLADRGLLRRYHYDFKDVVSSDGSELFEQVADIPKFDIKEVAVRECARGVPWSEFLFKWRRSIPLQMIMALKEIFRAAQSVGKDFIVDSFEEDRPLKKNQKKIKKCIDTI